MLRHTKIHFNSEMFSPQQPLYASSIYLHWMSPNFLCWSICINCTRRKEVTTQWVKWQNSSFTRKVLQQSVALHRKWQLCGETCARICPVYTRRRYESNIAKANDTIHNLPCNTDKRVSDVCCVQAPAVAPSGFEQQLNRITVCAFWRSWQLTSAQARGGLYRDRKYTHSSEV